MKPKTNMSVHRPPTDLGGLLLTGVLIAALITTAGWVGILKFWFHVPLAEALALLVETVFSFNLPLSSWTGRTDLAIPPAAALSEIAPGTVNAYRRVFEVLFAVSLGSGVGFVFSMTKKQRTKIIHKNGPQLLKNPRDLRAEIFKNLGKRDGIWIHPDVKIPKSLETRAFSLVGSPGSGKTTILNAWFDQVRGKHPLVGFDFKGDFVERVPDAEKLILSPWDRRAVRWNLGADVTDPIRTRLLAECLIPPNPRASEPFWGNASRAILRAEIHKLMATRAGKWGFSELGEGLLADILAPEGDEIVQNLVRTYLPESLRIVQDLTSRTTVSILIDQSTALQDTIMISRFDGELAKLKRPDLALVDYLASPPRGGIKPLILPSHPHSPSLTAAFLSSVLSVASSVVTNFPNAKPNEREIWIFADEVPQAGRIPTLTTFLETARSKGCRIVLGFQSPAQIGDRYDEKTLEIWDNSISTKIFLQCASPEAKKYVSQSVGEREILVYRESRNVGLAPPHTGRTENWIDERERLITPENVGLLLGPKPGRGVVGILSIAGSNPAILTWPFPFSLPPAAKSRDLLSLPPMTSPGSGASGAPSVPERDLEAREGGNGAVEKKEDRPRGDPRPAERGKTPPPVLVTPDPTPSPPSPSPEKREGPDGEILEEVGKEAEETATQGAAAPDPDPAGELLGHFAGVGEIPEYLKILAELSTPAAPAAGVLAEAQAQIRKKERENEGEEER